MEIVRTDFYVSGLRRLAKLGATEADIMAMESAIGADPMTGSVIPGSGGLRKVRFGFGRSGKRGGGRTIYFAVAADETVYLMASFAKVDREDVSMKELRLLKALAKELTDG